jgi:hypothetical protein
MPLRCLDQYGTNIQAFELDAAQWESLRAANVRDKHLRMACCDNKVVLKTSNLGTHFFAHQRRGPCTTKPESEEHLTLKTLVCRALAKAGWNVATEVRGHAPDGGEWVADVMATRGTARFAVEIQWSRQTDAETYARQERYRASGIKALWLFRQERYPNDALVPAIRVGRGDDISFEVYGRQCEVVESIDDPLPWAHWKERPVPVEDFIDAVCDRRFWYGVYRAGDQLTVRFVGAFIKCWKCSGWTNVVSYVVFSGIDNPDPLRLTLEELGRVPLLRKHVALDAFKRFKVGEIKERFSKTEGGSYLANGCTGCGALQGKFFLSEVDHRLKLIGSQQFTVTQELEQALRDSGDDIAESQWHLEHPRLRPVHIKDDRPLNE